MVLLAFAAFLIAHVALARPLVRGELVARLGEGPFLLSYSVLSVALLGWVVLELLAAPRTPLWAPPPGSRVFALICSALGFAMLSIGVSRANPFSVSFRPASVAAAAPGPFWGLRHPLLLGFGLWGLAHLPANGEWPTVVLFAGTVVFAVLGARGVERRRRLTHGETEWQAWCERSEPVTLRILAASCLGLFAWVLLLALHPRLFGVDPLAPWL